MHATASIAGVVVAETDNYEFVEGNVYFPTSSIKDPAQTLSDSSLTIPCAWKGEAHYYNLSVGGKLYKDAAWYYPTPSQRAEKIRDHVAFSKSDVHIEHHNGDGGSHGFMNKMKHMFKS